MITLRIRDALQAGPATLEELRLVVGHDVRNGRLHQLKQSGRVMKDGDFWRLVPGAKWRKPQLPKGALTAQVLAELKRGPKRATVVAERLNRNPGTIGVVFRRLEAQGRIVRRGMLWMLPEHAERIEAAERRENAARIERAMQSMKPNSPDYQRAQRTLAQLA